MYRRRGALSFLGLLCLLFAPAAPAGGLLSTPAARIAQLLPSPASPTTVCRVKPAASGLGDGSSWANATTLQGALGNAACTEIWVKYGVYKPGVNPGDSFSIRPGVAVYGGFGGSETTLAERTLAAMEARPPSVLSGDIDNNDTDANGNHVDETVANIQGTNSNHVVVIDGTSVAGPVTDTTILDGFAITGGFATGTSPSGGGLYCKGAGAGSECSPTLRNLWFAGNHADYLGGAIYDDGNSGGVSSPTVSAVTFSGNTAQFGGAVENDVSNFPGTSSPSFTNVTFSGNSSDQSGGAMYNFASGTGSTSSPVLTNVTFANNTAVSGYGGAIDEDGSSGGVADLQLDDVILWGDSAAVGPEILLVESATATINYSVVQGGDAGIGYANGDSGTPFASGNSNQSTDPLLSPLQTNEGYAPTRLPGWGGSAVDYGDYSTCPTTDERGAPRVQSNNCDIGAVEYRVASVYVSIQGNGTVNAESQPPPLQYGISACTGYCYAYYDGEIAPNSLYPVALDITPDPNWELKSVSGCGGALSGSVYYTADIDQLTGSGSTSSYCTVQVKFVPVTAITTLSSSLNPSPFGQIVTFTATVTPNPPATAQPTGSVTFYDAGALITGCVGRPLNSQNPPQVTCTPSTLAQGVHVITAQYNGDATYVAAAQPLSAPLTQAVAALAFGSRCYVTTAGLEANDGSSWANAKTLQGALDEAGCAEIWVATGIYEPVIPAIPGSPTTDELKISFRPLPGTVLYGGFAGTETALSQRTLADIAAHPSILSGDIGNDDANTGGVVVSWQNIAGVNSYHVVYFDGAHAFAPVTATTILDGFTITAGEANDFGGGMYCDGLGRDCSPTLRNLVFAGNLANTFGGALFNEGSGGGGSSPTLSNVIFYGNAAVNGGAVFNDAGYLALGSGGAQGGVSSPRFDNVLFSNNAAVGGGAGGGAVANVAVYGGASSPAFTNVTFGGNSAGQTASAVLNYGVYCTPGTTASPEFSNVTFSSNSVVTPGGLLGGGAILNITDNGCTNTLRMTNVTFGGNSAQAGNATAISNLTFDLGQGVSTTPGVADLAFTNVILWDAAVPEIIETGTGAAAALDHSIVQGGDAGIMYLLGAAGTPFASGPGNVNADPLLGPLQNNGGLTPTLLPAAGSAAIDAGRSDNLFCSLYDQRGLQRPQGAACDIGSVEVVSPLGSDHIFLNGFEGP